VAKEQISAIAQKLTLDQTRCEGADSRRSNRDSFERSLALAFPHIIEYVTMHDFDDFEIDG
jgi:hypothetical protein